MNIENLINSVSYQLMTLRPNIKRIIHIRRQLKNNKKISNYKLNILFGVHPVWETTIQKAFQHSDHQVFFEDFTPDNIGKYDLVIPLNIPETRFLNEHINLISENIIPLPNNDIVTLCDDKLLFYECLSKKGFGNYLPKIGSNSGYPFVIKKRVTHFGMDSEIVANKEDEVKFAEIITSPDYIAQEYIAGKHEYAAHVLFKNGKIVTAITIKHVHRSKVYIRGHQKEKTIFSEITSNRFMSLFADILQAINFQGICCIDYKILKGKLYILEINPRIGSSCIEYLLSFINSVNKDILDKKKHSVSELA